MSPVTTEPGKQAKRAGACARSSKEEREAEVHGSAAPRKHRPAPNELLQPEETGGARGGWDDVGRVWTRPGGTATGAGLLLRSFQRLQSVNQGFNSERVLSFDLTLPGVKYRTVEVRSRFFESLIEKLRSSPGLEEIGITSRVPLERKSGDVLPYSVEGQPKPLDNPPDAMDTIIASPGYFRAMG